MSTPRKAFRVLKNILEKPRVELAKKKKVSEETPK
jgi:hypothetical protein